MSEQLVKTGVTTTLAPQTNNNSAAPSMLTVTRSTKTVNNIAERFGGDGVTVKESTNLTGGETPPVSQEKTEGNVEASTTPTTVEQAEAKPETSHSDKMARLLRIEKRSREQATRLAARARDVEAREAKLGDVEKWARLPDRIKSSESKLALLNELGLAPQDIIDEIINTAVVKEPVSEERKRLDEIEGKLKKQEEAASAAARQNAAQAENDGAKAFMQSGMDHVKQHLDDFEMIQIKGSDAWDDVWQLSEATYRQTGKVPDVVDMIKKVESYYEEEAYAAASKAKKIQKRLGMLHDEAAPAPTASRTTVTRPTLGGRVSQRVPPVTKQGERISDEERLRRVIAWGKANLAQR